MNRLTKPILLATLTVAAVLGSTSSAGAAPAPVDRPAATQVAKDPGVTTSGVPLLSKPADMTTEEWYSVNPFHGMTLGQQAQYYKNGLHVREMLQKLKGMPDATSDGVLITPIYFAGQLWHHSQWKELREVIRSNDYYMQTGLRQWYDSNPDNDNYLTASDHWLKAESGTVNGEPVPVTDPDHYSTSIGYNPNYFSSVEEQTAWLSDKIVNRWPFPSDESKPYNDYQVIAGGLYMYSDGTSPAPTTGGWEESWARVIPEGFDPSQGTSPYHPEG